MNEEQKKLALEIMHCPMVEIARTDTSRACNEIVNVQKGEFQLPEPWNGNINAPILFLSSNAGYDPDEDTVTSSWDTDKALTHFEARLVSQFRKKDGSPKNSPDFFRYIKDIATEILVKEADPVRDFCSAEIVHCKSNNEQGVPCAIRHCADRYFEKLLAVSGAQVVILVGSATLGHVRALYNMEIDYGTIIKRDFGQREFMFAAVYHNNARFEGVGAKRNEVMNSIRQPLRDYLNLRGS
jgi:hypothetical protein